MIIVKRDAHAAVLIGLRRGLLRASRLCEPGQHVLYERGPAKRAELRAAGGLLAGLRRLCEWYVARVGKYSLWFRVDFVNGMAWVLSCLYTPDCSCTPKVRWL